MSGFFAMPPEAWEIIVSRRQPGEWDEWEAIADLRYWVDWIGGAPRREPPTEAALCTRWGWGNRRVRRLFDDVPKWADILTGKLGASLAFVARARARAPRRFAQQERSSDAVATQQECSSAEPANADNTSIPQQERSSDAVATQQECSTHARDLRARPPSTAHPPPVHDPRSVVGIAGAPEPPPTVSTDRATMTAPEGDFRLRTVGPTSGVDRAIARLQRVDMATTERRVEPDPPAAQAPIPPPRTWPHPAAALLAERCPELAVELAAPATWSGPWATATTPDEALLVAAWALDAPDPLAQRLRLEHRAWRYSRPDLAKRPRFRPKWLFDPVAWAERLGAADQWHAQGRPVAEDALMAAESEATRAALTARAGQVAELLARAKGRAAARLAEELQLLRDAGVEPRQVEAIELTPEQERAELQATANAAVALLDRPGVDSSAAENARGVLEALAGHGVYPARGARNVSEGGEPWRTSTIS